MKKFITGFAAILLCLAVAGCGESMQKTRSLTFQQPRAISLEKIDFAVRSGGERRYWKMTPVRPGEMIAELERGNVYIKVRLNYDSRMISATYLDSRGLKYNGVRIHWKYGKWVEELMDTIELHIRRV